MAGCGVLRRRSGALRAGPATLRRDFFAHRERRGVQREAPGTFRGTGGVHDPEKSAHVRASGLFQGAVLARARASDVQRSGECTQRTGSGTFPPPPGTFPGLLVAHRRGNPAHEIVPGTVPPDGEPVRLGLRQPFSEQTRPLRVWLDMAPLEGGLDPGG
jgi:hypothetical protein